MQENKQLETLLQEQIHNEEYFSMRGKEQYIRQVEKLDGGMTDYANILYRRHIPDLVEGLQILKSKHNYKDVFNLVNILELETIAYIVLHTVLDNCVGSNITLTSLCNKVSAALHTEVTLRYFKEQNPNYLKTILNEFNHRNINSMQHKKRVIIYTANNKGIKYEQWSQQASLRVGLMLVTLVLKTLDIIKKTTIVRAHRPTHFVELTDSFKKWSDDCITLISKQKICKPPCIIQPKDWLSFDDGGYYTPEQQLNTKFVAALPRHYNVYRKHFKYMPKVVSAVNALQHTKWRVNKEMIGYLKAAWEMNLPCLPSKDPLEIPEFECKNTKEEFTEAEKELFVEWKHLARNTYTKEKKRLGKSIAIARTIFMADYFSKYNEIYFVYNADFRGRLYCASYGLSPQDADYSKALLEFAEGKELGDRGVYWLKIHLANTYGVDKVSFDERIKWVADTEEKILMIANNPFDNMEWVDADKPFQFLRACLEYREFKKYGKHYKSTLPVGMDGSCNGLQNFSALLRDKVGGAATNLTPNDKPADIYQVVADKVIDLLQKDDSLIAKRLLDFGITRKIAKRPVMTLPYGSTQRSCFQSIIEHLEDKNYEYDAVDAAKYLTPVLWGCIGTTVQSAITAMDWLKNLCSLVIRAGMPIIWYSPVNFLVVQDKKKCIANCRIGSSLYGTIRISYNRETETLDLLKNKSGISPNFIHSLDASHLMFTINDGIQQGITQWACIHDDYGTYAADIDKLNTIIRDNFVNMYKNFNPLKNIRDYYLNKKVIIPDIPEYGKLNLDDVLSSKYFFC